MWKWHANDLSLSYKKESDNSPSLPPPPFNEQQRLLDSECPEIEDTPRLNIFFSFWTSNVISTAMTTPPPSQPQIKILIRDRKPKGSICFRLSRTNYFNNLTSIITILGYLNYILLNYSWVHAKRFFASGNQVEVRSLLFADTQRSMQQKLMKIKFSSKEFLMEVTIAEISLLYVESIDELKTVVSPLWAPLSINCSGKFKQFVFLLIQK